MFKISTAFVFFILCLSRFGYAQTSQEVWVTVSATNEDSGPVTDLKPENFVIKIGKTVQNISAVRVDANPYSVAILFDSSGSMAQKTSDGFRPSVIDGIRQLITSANENNEYFIAAFNTELRPIENNFLSRDNAERAVLKLADVVSAGNTSFFDSVYETVRMMDKARNRKKVLIVVSDGLDTYSRATMGDVRKRLIASSVTVYSVTLEKRGIDFLKSPGFVFLDEMSSLTGGKSFYAKSAAEIPLLFASVEKDIRGQYSLGFVPVGYKPGQPIGLNVSMNLSDDDKRRLGKVKARHRKEIVLN